LYDMAGNVEEWCNDLFPFSGVYSDSAQIDPTGPASGSNNRVSRGGSWAAPQEYLRSACRNYFDQKESWSFYGLRVVCR
ncbi:MAG: SUMF1/EgtB/PvdO family nonheme iron enzyme, partial [Fibrobacteres bacterium]|nr:SUMF1/EgtB/PvdO family nonheme iron enzyme [Fibrobacterota bacterium]